MLKTSLQAAFFFKVIFMSDFVLNSLPNLVIASYSSSRLGQYALNYGNRFMLIMDPVPRAVGPAQKITSSLSDRNVDYFVFYIS